MILAFMHNNKMLILHYLSHKHEMLNTQVNHFMLLKKISIRVFSIILQWEIFTEWGRRVCARTRMIDEIEQMLEIENGSFQICWKAGVGKSHCALYVANNMESQTIII